MAQRRTLAQGLKPDPASEKEFVRTGTVPRTESAPPVDDSPPAPEAKARTANAVGRAPLTIRFRADFAEALKRASLERQLHKVVPNSLQDILDEAVEPWLRQNGYLP
jgi:hypothetical protein